MSALDRATVSAWVDGYERAWRTPGTDELSRLFASEATYRTAPFEHPFVGLPAIAEMWERGREGPDEHFTMNTEVLAVDGDTAVVRVEVFYGEPHVQHYRDLWVIRFDSDGRCVHFEEWPFWPAGSPGAFHPGPAD